MKGLILDKKTGFRNNQPNRPVTIRDFRGKMFYDTTGLSKVDKFNLPAGSYFVEAGNITALPRPVFFPLIRMPKPERKLAAPLNFLVRFDDNPNKCTINWDKKYIMFDNSLLSKTIPELWFILFHEYGHSLYKSEHLADQMSANLMLQKGFNPSQIGKAPITSLSTYQLYRKKNLVKKFINNSKPK